jgi:hypothetical protein
MSILKIEPSAINTQADFSLGSLTVAGNVNIGGATIAETNSGALAFTTTNGAFDITANTVNFLNTVANTSIAPGGSIGGSSGGSASTEIYNTVASLPASGVANGTLAYVSANNSLYVQSASQWKRVYTGSDGTLDVTTEPPVAVTLDFSLNSVRQHVITFAASDPEGFPVTYGYAINPANSVNIQSVTNNNGVYTLQTTANLSTLGSAVFRATATDGLHVISRSQTLNFIISSPISLSGGTSGATVYTAPNGTVVTASDTVYDNTNYRMAHMFNGTTTGALGTYWLSNSANTGTLTFNFANSSVTYLHSIQIFPRSRDDTFTSVVNIEISANGSNWTTVPNTAINVTSATAYGSSQTFLLTTFSRYVRLNLSKTGSWGLSLDDVRFTGA